MLLGPFLISPKGSSSAENSLVKEAYISKYNLIRENKATLLMILSEKNDNI